MCRQQGDEIFEEFIGDFRADHASKQARAKFLEAVQVSDGHTGLLRQQLSRTNLKTRLGTVGVPQATIWRRQAL
jgi:hypothetical protein